MKEIERIIAELDKDTGGYFNQGDIDRIRSAMIKTAFAAIVDGNVAREIVAHVENLNKKEKIDGK